MAVISRRNEKEPERLCKTLGGGGVGGGQIRCIMGCASDESSYFDQASLVNKVFILWPNYRGFDSLRFVLLLFSILRVGRPPRH